MTSNWLKGPAFLQLESPNPIGDINLPISLGMGVGSKQASLRTNTKHMSEAVTTGTIWLERIQQIKAEQGLSNDVEASLQLQRRMQREAWPKGLNSIDHLPKPQRDLIMKKAPFKDPTDGLIRVGGRLARSDLTFGRKHPVLIPDTEAGDDLVGYLHSQTLHQGRKTMMASIRKAGFYPLGGRHRVDQLIANCVHC